MRIIVSAAVVIYSLLLTAYSYPQEVLLENVEYIEGKYMANGRDINGFIVDYYDNDRPKLRFKLLEGRLHGQALLYYPDGKIKSKRNYTFNKLFGRFIEYDQNGKEILDMKVDLNAYQSGEIVLDVQIKKGNKLRNRGKGTLYFQSEDQETFNYSEELFILDQNLYFIQDEKGRIIYQNY